ncbi:MAG: putative toxin-antitoxin system toxin component, PIN family [Patescibacteria group bacterium]
MSSHNFKVVIDTNVWVSGLVFGGTPGDILHQFIDEKIIVIISEEIITELHRIIITKFPLLKPKLSLLEASIRKDSTLVYLGDYTVRVSRDPDDNKIIETAIVGDADYIISGDEDLLSIGQYEGIKIIKPAEFLSIDNGYSQ